MAKMDFSDALKKAGSVAKKATDKAAATAKAGAEKAAVTAQAGAKALRDTRKKETDKISESVKTAAERRKEDIAEKQRTTKEKAVNDATGVQAVSPQNAVKIFYYLMAVDGEITPDEEEKFELIGKGMDPNFEAHKEELIKECEEQVKETIVAEDYYAVIRNAAEKALTGEQISNNGFVTPKLLVWNLLTIANGDNEYGEEEQKLIKFVVGRLDIEDSVFLELESSIMTVGDIEKEITWIKGTNRPYLVVEKQVKELEKRRNDILLAAKALIML